MRRTAILTIAIASALCGGLSAFAQDAADPAAVWERFVEDCSAVVAAPDPAMHAASALGGSGGAGRTADGRVSTATVSLNLPAGGGEATMIVTVNDFADGRSVQCMLQMIQPDPALAGLAAISRERAGELIGPDVTAAGGPVAEINVVDGLPFPGAAPQAEMLRFSDSGFPPERILIVQSLPIMLLLIYGVMQPAE